MSRSDASGIKIKAAIWTKARTVRFRTMKQKDVVGGVFKADGQTYLIHPDRALLTHAYTAGKLWLFRTYYQTYYYLEGCPQPIPPLLDGSEEPVLDVNGKPQYDSNGRPITAKVFPKAVNLGLNSEELSGTSNPYFLRIISQVGPQWWEQVGLLALMAIGAGVAFLVYQGTQQPSLEDIQQAVRAAVAAASASSSAPAGGGTVSTSG